MAEPLPRNRNLEFHIGEPNRPTTVHQHHTVTDLPGFDLFDHYSQSQIAIGHVHELHDVGEPATTCTVFDTKSTGDMEYGEAQPEMPPTLPTGPLQAYDNDTGNWYNVVGTPVAVESSASGTGSFCTVIFKGFPRKVATGTVHKGMLTALQLLLFLNNIA